ncbi:MAG: ATP-binding protein [Planctomycetota bacterium]|jgi:PAS domain S-box-containing protein
MIHGGIEPSSAGTLAVATVAFFFFIFQAWVSVKRPEFRWNRWGAALTLVTVIYSVAVFVQFNTPANALNHLSELFQYASFMILLHSVYGFTFSYLSIEAKKYHLLAGITHSILLVILWSTDLVVGEGFVYREFIGLKNFYIEPDLGPIGPYYLLYTAIAGAFVFTFWWKYKKRHKSGTNFFLIGFLIWAILGLHDALATLGLPTIQFLMEYGFLGFSTSVMYVTLKKYIELFELAQARKEELQKTHDQLELRVEERTTELRLLNKKLRHEVTDRKLSEEALRQSEERLIQAQAVAHVGNWELDLKTGNIWGSEEAILIYGLDATTPIFPGDRVLELIHPDDRQTMDDVLKGLIESNQTYDTEFRIYRAADRTPRWIHSKAELRHDDNGRPVKVLGVIQDITERKEAEKEKEKLHKRLLQAQKMEVIGTLAGGVAHDLNNILSGIVSYPELLLMDIEDDNPLRESILAIKQSGEKAAVIVQDLLTLARRGVSATQVVNLNQIIIDYLDSQEFKELKKYHPEVKVENHLEGGVLNILGSTVHLSKTVMNLVSNAAEAIPAGGCITIVTENMYIDKPLEGYDGVEEGDYVVLSVSDTGVGISQDNLKRIFEPFYTKKVMGKSGTGLGMAVVWGTVKDHNGYIDVHSKQGEGTVIKLYFPVTRKVVDEDTKLPVENYTGDRELILVIDDVEEQRMIASHMLKKLNYQVEAAACGEEAVEFVKSKRPDLLVLDMIMDPGIDGYETYKRVLDVYPNQKAIIASGFAENDRVKETQKLGAGQYIKKPYTIENIGLAVKNELKKNKINAAKLQAAL